MNRIAVISRSNAVPFGQLQAFAIAVNTYLKDSQFASMWKRPSHVTAFEDENKIQPDFWKVFVEESISIEDLGIHSNDRGMPFALLQSSPTWTVFASQLIMKMLVNPHSRRVVIGLSPTDSTKKVHYLVDPCYPVSQSKVTVNNIPLADFVCPEFYSSALMFKKFQISAGGVQGRPLEVTAPDFLIWREGTTYYVTMPNEPLCLGTYTGSLNLLGRWLQRPLLKDQEPKVVDFEHEFKAEFVKEVEPKVEEQQPEAVSEVEVVPEVVVPAEPVPDVEPTEPEAEVVVVDEPTVTEPVVEEPVVEPVVEQPAEEKLAEEEPAQTKKQKESKKEDK